MQPLKTKKNKAIESECNKGIEGKYANYFKIGHNAFDFVFDFGQNFSDNEEAELYSRIITNPFYALELSETLKKAIDRYEEKFGSIKKKTQK
jgi:hypothetical protein